MIVNPMDYKPKHKGVSDKFSWNLYRALNKYKDADIKVYKFGWDFLGLCDPEKGQIVFMFGDESHWRVTGSLNRIMCTGSKNIGCCVSWSGNSWSEIEKIDITEDFFRNYLRNGRCSFGDGMFHEFNTINRNSRKCLHCGKIETRRVETVKQIKRIDRWD